MTYKVPKVSILEGKWQADSNLTVAEVFRPLFSVWAPNESHACYYEMFTTTDALQKALTAQMGKGKPGMIYIAAHGSGNNIEETSDQPIAPTLSFIHGCQGLLL